MTKILALRNYSLIGRESFIEKPSGSMALGCKNGVRFYDTGWSFPKVVCLIDPKEKSVHKHKFVMVNTGWFITNKARFVGAADYGLERVFVFEESIDGRDEEKSLFG